MNFFAVAALLVLGVVGWQQALIHRRALHHALREVARWKGVADSRTHQVGVWITRACERGYVAEPERVLGEIFRPMSAAELDDLRLAKEARQHHALDPRHHRIGIELPDAVLIEEAATEVMQMFVGPTEVEGD
jgi:hypothetical protein